MRSLDLAAVDLLVIAAYVLAALLIGWRRRRGRDAEDFLLAGRRLTLPLFVGSLVASWYGGLLGVGEIAYSDGLVNWVSQGGFWYLAYLLFALLLAGRLNRSRQTTLPDQMEALHGRAARHLASLLNFINVMPISYVLSLGLVIHGFTGWPLWLGILVGTSLGALYSLAGGFRAVIHVELHAVRADVPGRGHGHPLRGVPPGRRRLPAGAPARQPPAADRPLRRPGALRSGP